MSVCNTAVIRPYENPRALQGRTVFNRYLGIGRSNRKISKSKVVVFFNFASGRTLSTQSTGPQKLFFTDISVLVAQIKTNKKNKVHLFFNFASGRTLPTQSIGPQPIQLVPKHCFFYRYLSIGRSNKKYSKNKVHLFSNFASGRTLPTHENVYEGLNA